MFNDDPPPLLPTPCSPCLRVAGNREGNSKGRKSDGDGNKEGNAKEEGNGKGYKSNGGDIKGGGCQ